MSVQRQLLGIQQHVAGQGVTVGVQSRGGHGDHHITRAHAIRPQQVSFFDHADGGGGDVVLVRFHHTRVLGGLAAQQCTAGFLAARGDARNDAGNVLGHNLADGDVILQKQRLGAADHQVIHAHGNQVAADRIVLIHRLRHGQLGAHAVGGRGQQWLFVVPQRKQSGEATESAAHLGAGGLLS